MIGSTLQFIAKQMNEHICQVLQLDPAQRKVLLSPIVDPDGTIAVKERNVLLLQLINIEPDPIANGSQPLVHHPPGSDLVESPPLYLNLKLVLAAYFKPDQMQTGLDMLTLAIGYLQGKPLWTPSNSPALPKGVNRLVFEMESLDLHQLNHIWGAIGTKYLPSSVYRLKMLTINDHAIRGLVPSVESISSGVNQNGQ